LWETDREGSSGIRWLRHQEGRAAAQRQGRCRPARAGSLGRGGANLCELVRGRSAHLPHCARL